MGLHGQHLLYHDTSWGQDLQWHRWSESPTLVSQSGKLLDSPGLMRIRSLICLCTVWGKHMFFTCLQRKLGNIPEFSIRCVVQERQQVEELFLGKSQGQTWKNLIVVLFFIQLGLTRVWRVPPFSSLHVKPCKKRILCSMRHCLSISSVFYSHWLTMCLQFFITFIYFVSVEGMPCHICGAQRTGRVGWLLLLYKHQGWDSDYPVFQENPLSPKQPDQPYACTFNKHYKTCWEWNNIIDLKWG